MTTKITEKEQRLLQAIVDSEHHDGRDPVDDTVWIDEVLDAAGLGDGAGGVAASLHKKELIGLGRHESRTENDVIWIKAAGMEALRAATARPAGDRTGHKWDAHYCSCGCETAICQRCGAAVCAAICTWVDGVGNVEPACLGHYGLGHAGDGKQKIPTNGGQQLVETMDPSPTGLWWDETGQIACAAHAPYWMCDTWVWHQWQALQPADAADMVRQVGKAECEICHQAARMDPAAGAGE